MKRVLVTGATGFIGFELARQLVEHGYQTRLLVRRPLRGSLLSSLDAELVQGDLESRESLDRAVADVDTVIHLAARAVFEEYRVVRPSIVDGSVRLMDAARDAGAERFVFSSSLLVYGGQADWLDETTPVGTRLGYGRAKIEAEGMLRKRAVESEMALGIVRLPHVYGARDLMFEQVRRGRVYFPGRGQNLYSHLHVEDAARVLLTAGKLGWNGSAPVADDQPACWNDFFAEVTKFYPRFRTLGVPQSLAALGMRLYTPLRRMRGNPSVYTPEAVESWNQQLRVKAGVLWDQLGIQPKYPTIASGIPAALDECIAFRWKHPVADTCR